VYSLGLVNGDLMVSSGDYLLLTGADKIRQDLTLALSEEFGTDRFHPRWGSIVKRYIGSLLTPQLALLVKAEVVRVVRNYIAIQQAEVMRDTQVDVQGRFDTSDVIRELVSVDTQISFDVCNIYIHLRTLNRATVKIKKQVIL
jgi:phage baseplate assembly protein W